MDKDLQRHLALATVVSLAVSGSIMVSRLSLAQTSNEGSSASTASTAQQQTVAPSNDASASYPPSPTPSTLQKGIVCTFTIEDGVQCLRDGIEPVSVPSEVSCRGVADGGTCPFSGLPTNEGAPAPYGQQSGAPSGQPTWDTNAPYQGSYGPSPNPESGNDGRDAQGNYMIPQDQLERYMRESGGAFCIIPGSTAWTSPDSPQCQGGQIYGTPRQTMHQGMGQNMMQGPGNYGQYMGRNMNQGMGMNPGMMQSMGFGMRNAPMNAGFNAPMNGGLNGFMNMGMGSQSMPGPTGGPTNAAAIEKKIASLTAKINKMEGQIPQYEDRLAKAEAELEKLETSLESETNLQKQQILTLKIERQENRVEKAEYKLERAQDNVERYQEMLEQLEAMREEM